MGDRIALMDRGALIQTGTPEEIYTRPQNLFVARFFCELNEIAGTVHGGFAETSIGRFAAPGLGEGASAIVAIRPQALRIRAGGPGVQARSSSACFPLQRMRARTPSRRASPRPRRDRRSSWTAG